MAEDKDTRRRLAEQLIDDEEQKDLLFKAQMGIAHLFLGYWKVGLGLLGVVLVASLGYGLFQNHHRDTQREIQAQIARVVRDLPTPNPAAPMMPAYTDAQKAKLAEVAAALEDVAEDSSGSGATYAWMRAAETWELADKLEESTRAWHQAYLSGGAGALGWAGARHEVAALEADGKVDEAVPILRGYADAKEGLISEQALYTLGEIFADAGRSDESVQVFEEFGKRFPNSLLSTRVAEALAEQRNAG